MTKLRTVLSAFAFRTTRGRRGGLLVYSGIVTLALFGLAALIAARANDLDPNPRVDALQLADLFCVLLMGGALFILTPAIVAAQVAEERRSGTLDLLRTAPLSPTMLVVGFVTGAPSAIYLLLAGPLGLHVVAGLLGRLPLHVLVESLLVLGAGTIVLVLLAIHASLAFTREGGGAATPMLVAIGFGLALMTMGFATEVSTAPWAFLHPAGALGHLYGHFRGPYQEAFMSSSYHLQTMYTSHAWPWMQSETTFGVLVYGLGALFLLVAVRRALAGDPPARFTKPEAIGLFGVVAAALLVPLRASAPAEELRTGTLAAMSIFLSLPYVICVLGATPNAIAYGTGRASMMSDRGSPILAALAMLAVALLLTVGLFGSHATTLFSSGEVAARTIAFGLVALTVPIYALFAATRISTQSVRVAFWSAIAAHLVLQVPSWISVCDGTDYGVGQTLARIGACFGVVLPLVVAWRQRVGDRKRVAT